MRATCAQLEELGFVVCDRLLAPNEVQQLADRIEESGLKRSKAGIRHALKNGAIVQLATEPRLLGLAQEVLGPEAMPFRATLFDKSATANWLVVWHQDTALPLCERRDTPGWGPWSIKDSVVYAHAPASALCRVLALRVHLDDSNLDNGPLRVLSGTHRNGVLTGDEIAQLAGRIAPTHCSVRQGGVLAMRPLIVHASSKSQSQAPRRVIHIEYAASRKFSSDLELAIA